MEPTQNAAGIKAVTATQLAAPGGEIARLLDELNMETINLLDNTAGLSDALRPVLRNEPVADNLGKELKEASTDLGSYLHSVIARVKSTNRIVIDARGRLEL